MKLMIALALLAAGAAVAASVTPLATQMRRLAADLKQVDTDVGSGAVTAATTTALGDMADAAVKARPLIPLKAQISAEETAAYQNAIDQLSDEIASLKDAVSRGDLAAAKDLIARIKQTRNDGHDRFKQD